MQQNLRRNVGEMEQHLLCHLIWAGVFAHFANKLLKLPYYSTNGECAKEQSLLIAKNKHSNLLLKFISYIYTNEIIFDWIRQKHSSLALLNDHSLLLAKTNTLVYCSDLSLKTIPTKYKSDWFKLNTLA